MLSASTLSWIREMVHCVGGPVLNSHFHCCWTSQTFPLLFQHQVLLFNCYCTSPLIILKHLLKKRYELELIKCVPIFGKPCIRTNAYCSKLPIKHKNILPHHHYFNAIAHHVLYSLQHLQPGTQPFVCVWIQQCLKEPVKANEDFIGVFGTPEQTVQAKFTWEKYSDDNADLWMWQGD